MYGTIWNVFDVDVRAHCACTRCVYMRVFCVRLRMTIMRSASVYKMLFRSSFHSFILIPSVLFNHSEACVLK